MKLPGEEILIVTFKCKSCERKFRIINKDDEDDIIKIDYYCPVCGSKEGIQWCGAGRFIAVPDF